MPDRRARVAFFTSHVIQYMAPLYRALSQQVDLEVFFAHDVDSAEQARAGFNVAFDWDTPIRDGYRSQHLPNEAARPGVDRFWGTHTPAIGDVLARGRFDALVVNGWNLRAYWQAIRAARRAGVPVMVRGDSQLAAPRGPGRRFVKRLLFPRLLTVFDAFLAVGQRSRLYYEHYGVPDRRIFFSPHCVDNDFFAGAAAAVGRQAARAAVGVPADAVLFVFAGKLIAKKRPFDFLAALDLVARDDRRVHGLIVGDGPLRAGLEAHQRRAATPCCTFAGFMNQQRMPVAYAAADALVLPSDGGETWGLVVNEAMAAGTPAIVSDAAGCAPDLIVPGGTGFTYPCGDVEALADRMRRMAADPDRAATAERVRAHIAHFSPEVAAAGVVRAVAAVAALGRPAPRKEARHADARA